MRLLVIADCDDAEFRDDAPADVIFALGDLMTDYILSARERSGAERVFAVKGNHDHPKDYPDEFITDVHLKVTDCSGFTVGGMNGAWKYKRKGHFLYTQDEAKELLEPMPAADIFISHNSPAGLHERDIGLDEHHQGFEAAFFYVLNKRPKIFFHGHQHCNTETRLRKTRVIGVYGYRYFEMSELLAGG